MASLITIDDVARVLDRFPLSVPGAAAIALYSYKRSRDVLGPSLRFTDHLKGTRWLSLLLTFVALKTANRAFTRLVRNHGWKADPPKWINAPGKGDVVLITGGSTGIGKEMVEILAKKTSKIAVLDMAPPTYKAKNVRYYKCDVTDPAAIKAVAEQIRAEIGPPTILVNNAGIARGNTILNTRPEEFLLTYKVNVLGAHNILREFLPYITSIDHGHIMTTASSASYMAVPQLSEYCCSKAAVLALHEVLTLELVHRYNAPHVRTSVVCPTKVSTQMGDAMLDQENQFMAPTLSPVWLATQMVNILESGLSDHLVAPKFAAWTLPPVRAFPDWFRWILNTVGKTHLTITDARNAKQKTVYKLGELMDKAHGLAP